MKAREQISNLNRQISAILETPCAECGHPYYRHVSRLRCYETRCRCKVFVDPDEAS